MDARKRRNSRGGLIAILCGVALLVCASGPVRADVKSTVKRALPATVGVEWRDQVEVGAVGDATVRKLLTKSGNQIRMASGTIVSPDGRIVTTLEGAEKGSYSVTLQDGRSLPARLLVDDRRSGLRLLKVDAANLPSLSLVTEPAQIGEEVTTTYCLDLTERAALRGIVSATGRELKGLGAELLQLDFNAGMMSGGAPVVNEQGDIIGIIAFRRSGNPGLTFAIPARAVLRLLEAPQTETPAVIRRGMLGIIVSAPTPDDGSVLARLASSSPAAAAGMMDGDEILSVDGAKLGSLQEMARLLSARIAGEKVHIVYRRNGKEQAVDVTLAPAPDEAAQEEAAVGADGRVAPPTTKSVVRVHPDSIYVVEDDGKVQALKLDDQVKSIETLKQYYQKAFRAQLDAAGRLRTDGDKAVAPTIHIERSNVEKKLEEIGRDVQSLKQQTEKLTEELLRLQKQLANEPPKPQ